MSCFSVTVFCGSSPGNDPAYAHGAQMLGQGLASRQMPLIFGAGNVGLMGHVASAVLAGGGKVTGVIPEFLRQREIPIHDLTTLITTDSMHTRKRRLFALGDVFVVLPGGLGTYDETFEILTWKQLGQHNKPIILVNLCGWADIFTHLIEETIKRGFAKPEIRDLFEVQPNIPGTLARLDELSSS